MTASELHRKLLFYGFSDITEFLKNSPLNRYLYKKMLECRESGSVETPVLTLFNELYFQCVRVGFDINPGDAIMRRYIEEEIWWLKSKEAAMLVFSFVWLILKMKRILSFNEECFLEHLTPILTKSRKGKESLEAILQDMKENDIKVPDQFAPMVYPVVKAIPMQRSDDNALIKKIAKHTIKLAQDFVNFIPTDNDYQPNPNAWMELTDNYSHAWIEKFVKLYSNKNDSLALLERIEYSIPRNECKKHEDFFLGLRMHIESGQVVYRVVRDKEMDSIHDWIEVESFGMKEALNPYTNELKNLADQYKDERDEARRHIDEMTKHYEMEITRLQSKLESLNKELESKTVAEKVDNAEPKELSLTVSEMAEHVKERFSKSGADEFITMFYRLSLKHGYLDERTCNAIDAIIPYILERGALRQNFDIKEAENVYINPTVNNHAKDEK